MVGRTGRRRGLATGATVLAVSTGLLGAAAGAVAAPEPTAQAARTINVTETVSLRLVRKSGSTLYERGTARGTLSGAVTARFETSLTKVTGRVTIRPRGGGSFTIKVNGHPTSAGTNARFEGTMKIVGGTGRYADASGSGRFSGIVNRRSWDVVVQANGRLSY